MLLGKANQGKFALDVAVKTLGLYKGYFDTPYTLPKLDVVAIPDLCCRSHGRIMETLENLKTAIKSTKKLCAVMLDTVGAEMQVVNKKETAISLQADSQVVLTLDQGQEASSEILSINFGELTKHAEDVRQAREFLSTLGDLSQTQIFAKIENVEGLIHFDEILQEADGIILSRGNLGIDLPP
ncbi:hypothetical protein KIW84_035300 [Lathyrus oleraceus]|uniref:pyruvate kinase n=2 Tax=Pisum sativum TaxID=3888 RepID=A0A9D4Y0T7_PEA|nr:hypothetical protein KIW84_035300 [Pisum sativum]